MNWTRGHTIGRGSSATVSLATSSRSGDIFAVKSAEVSQSEFLQREQKILSALSSPHIVTYMGHDVTSESSKLMYNLLIEYASSGTIIDAIRSQGGELNKSTIRNYTRDIVRGLEYLHSHGLVHCDIKGRNILACDGGPKIADFGCAKWANPAGASTAPIAGTPMFMAPEVARGEEQGFPCDIWGLGCTIIEMATGGAVPWPNATDPVTVLYQIGYSEQLPEIPSFLSDQAKDFLGKCLVRDPTERWTVDQLLKHSFLSEEEGIMISCSSSAKQVEESESFSPTSILDQGIWNSLREPETLDDLDSSSDDDQRIRRLPLFSAEPRWSWDDYDETWITVRGNDCVESCSIENGADAVAVDNEEEFNFLDKKSCKIDVDILGLWKNRKNSDISLSLSNLILERDTDNLLFPSISSF